jgi:hypothetical protein
MIALAVYSYFEVKTPLPRNGPHIASAAPLLFAIQLLTSVIFFLVPYFPESVHFGSRRLTDYAPDQLERIKPLLGDMIGLMGLLMALYFTVNVHLLIAQALAPSPREAVRAIVSAAPWLTGGLLVGETFIIFYYLRLFDSA